jgi:phosphoglycolate/pyridoxal phosphate phosphatase family
MREPQTLDKISTQAMLDDIDYVIFDCDGVLWIQDQMIEGVDYFINWIRENGKKVIFATNNNTASRQSLMNKLNGFGFNASLAEIMVPSWSLVLYLKKLYFTGKVYVIGSATLKNEIKAAGFEIECDEKPNDNDWTGDGININDMPLDPEIKAVVIGYDNNININKLIKACSYAARISSHLFIATNMDTTYPTKYNDLVVPGTGAYVSMVEKVVDKGAVAIGKPSTYFFDCIKLIHPSINPSKCLMIGDRLDSDIAFGRNNGIKYTLLVGTGVHSLSDVKKYVNDNNEQCLPTHYTRGISELNKFLSK